MSENKKSKVLTTIYNLTAGRRKWLIAAGSIITLVLLAMVLAANKTTTPAPDKTLTAFKARRDNLTVTVTESGSIKARKSIDLKSEVEGRATIINIVPEGSYVTQEDVDSNKILVELDSGDLKEQLTQRQIDFTTAESGYAEANEAYAIQLKQNESDIATALLKVKFALMDFQKYLGGPLAEQIILAAESDPNSTYNITSLLDDPNKLGRAAASQTLTDLQDQIELAGSKLAKAQYKLEGTQQLYEANYVAEIELKGDELEKRSYEIQNKQAGITLDLFKRYDFPKEAEKLLSDYYEAKRALDRTYARTRSELAQAKARLESAKARLDLQQERLTKTRKQFAACTIKAPAPGLVVYGSSMEPMNRFRGTGLIAPGEQVFQRQTIITLPDTSEMMAEITVHESSIDKVKLGQKATIIMDAFPDQTFTGEVIKVAQLPDQQRNWLSPDIKVYTTQVSIEGTHNFLKPGMSARVEILVDSLADVLIVPVQVVANRGGKKICFVVNAGRAVEKEVKTGLFNDTYVQILEGLQPGNEVLLNPPRITEKKTEPANQLLDKSREEPQQQERPMQDQPGQDRPMRDRSGMRDPNQPRRRPSGMPADFNQLDEETRNRIRQFREQTPADSNQPDDQTRERMRQFRGQIPQDFNQLDEETRNRIRQFRNRSREQGDGESPRQNP
jgi:HlyD family secretion protein